MSFYPDTTEWPTVRGWRISPGVDWCPEGHRVCIGDNVCIENRVSIENRVWIDDNTWIGDNIWIGDSVRIGDGSQVDNYVRIDDDVWIGDRVYLDKGVRLGDGVHINEGVRLGHDVRLGDNVILHAECTKAVALGYDPRGYALVVALQKGIPMFGAGCRWFTFLEAREHWGTDYEGTGNRKYFQIMIDAAEGIAALWEKE